MLYTTEVYKKDGRCKEGEKLIDKTDVEFSSLEEAEEEATKKYGDNPKFRYEINETMVERLNIMSGKTFMERYDTPYYLSPSSETYWSR